MGTIILFCTALIGFSMFVSQGVQNSLENQFQAEDGLNVTHPTYMSFMTFFSILNIPGSFLGQILSTVGAFYISIPVMLLGRSVFGLSVEIINICVFAQIVYWFQGKLYNFAYASTVATARLGMVTVMLIGPMLTKNYAVKNCYLLEEKLGFPVGCPSIYQNQTVIAKLAEIAFVNGTIVENGYVSAKMQITIMYAITCAVMLLGVAATIVMFVITPPFKTFKAKETVSIKTNYSSCTIRIKSKLKSTF